jgi:hypothetical protein
MALVAAVIVCAGVFLNWYRMDFSRALSLVQMVDPSEAQQLRNNPHLGLASEALGERGLQTVSGVIALGAAAIAVIAVLVVLVFPAAAAQASRAGKLIFGCGVIILAVAAWSLLHKPDAALLIDRVLNVPVMSIVGKGLAALTGIGGAASSGLNALYPVAIGIGLPVTMIGGAVLAGTGLTVAMTAPSPVASTGTMRARAAKIVSPVGLQPSSAGQPAASSATAGFCYACGKPFVDAKQKFCSGCGTARE